MTGLWVQSLEILRKDISAMAQAFTHPQTHLIKSWLDSDQARWKEIVQRASRAWELSRHDPQLLAGYLSRRQIAAGEMSAWVEELVWSHCPLAESHGVFYQLLDQSLSEVDWAEIALHYVSAVAVESPAHSS